ncbi:39S ribosomal protein L52, mitochondrial [Schistocerca serialis cubense]|uniref:39S ribosomal protein L52, mitochondrial n=1 Tax=Schistocerca serialis cubense TaxID=2023355 RepID=UPI00214F2975|nr:39S ribosomal protein L52, mitochondrial [Schistocerca serialis cubense]
MSKLLRLDKICASRNALTKLLFSTSTATGLEQKWRRENGLPENPNKELSLINSPDYTFLDGRTTPLGVRQKKRLLKQQEYAEKIVKLTQEMDFAVERHERLKREEEEYRKNIINSKLKPKGSLLKLEK